MGRASRGMGDAPPGEDGRMALRTGKARLPGGERARRARTRPARHRSRRKLSLARNERFRLVRVVCGQGRDGSRVRSDYSRWHPNAGSGRAFLQLGSLGRGRGVHRSLEDRVAEDRASRPKHERVDCSIARKAGQELAGGVSPLPSTGEMPTIKRDAYHGTEADRRHARRHT